METVEKGGKEEMIYFLLIMISLCVGCLIGIGIMLFEEYKIKPFRKAVEEATNELINSLEKSNGIWRDETDKWSNKYLDLLNEKVNK